MTSYFTESDFRRSELAESGIGFNAAFLHDIKQDHVEFRDMMGQLSEEIKPGTKLVARELADRLGQLRDEIETYFALEEFYGCFDHALDPSLQVCRQAEHLKNQHTELFVQLNELVDRAEQVVYHESTDQNVASIIDGFVNFENKLKIHEQLEMEMILSQFNDDIGVGD